MRATWPIAVAVCIAGTVFAGPAFAQPAPIRLEWQAPAACPPAEGVLARARRLLGEGPAPDATAVHARAIVSRLGEDDWRLALETGRGDDRGERRLRGASCAELADATALILALMVDPASVSARPAEAGAGAADAGGTRAEPKRAGPRPVAAPGDDAAELRAPSPVQRAAHRIDAAGRTRAGGAGPHPAARPTATSAGRARDPRGPSSWRLGASVVGDLGSLPDLAPGVGLHAAWTRDRWRLDVAGTVLMPRAERVDGRSAAGGELLLGVAQARAGWSALHPSSAWWLGPSAGLEAGAMRGKGFGVSDPGRGHAPWIAVLGGAALGLTPAEHVGLSARLEAAVPLVRRRFVLQGVGTVHRAAAVAGRLTLGTEVRFP